MESKPNELSSAAALMGAKGGRAGKGKAKIRKTSFDSLSGSMAGAVGGAAGTGTAKRRNIDYAAIGRKGAQARRENLVAVEPKT